MSEDLNLKISQLMDNELEYDEALILLNTLADEVQSKHKLNRYLAISHALKNQVYLNVKSDFSETIAKYIQQESMLVLEKPILFKQTYQWLVLAASLAIIALVFEQSLGSQLFKPVATLQIAQQLLPEQSDLNKRITAYLQNHNFGGYAQSGDGVKSYAKVTIYNQK